MAELIFTLSDGRTQRCELGRDVQLIGRDPACDIALDDSSASRRHVRLRWENGHYLIEDLGSKNGTIVNNRQVQVAELRHLDEILIGSVEARFLDRPLHERPSTVVVSDGGPQDDTTHYSSRSHALELTARRLQLLYDLSERLTTLRGRDALLDDALNICFETLRFERGAIGVRKRRGRTLEWPVVRNLRGTGGELTISRSILGRALDHGERAIFTEGGGPIDPTVSMVQHGIRSAMCVPLKREDDILGVIYGDRISTGTVYTKEDVDFLAGLGRQVTIGLLNAELLEEQKSKLALEAELGVAREIQQQLFPVDMPDLPHVSIAGFNEPGRLVSGDYYDVLRRADGRIGFVVADVSGKGVAASLLMSNLQAAVRMTLRDCDDLGGAMTRWNTLLYDNTDVSKFVTCFAGLLDPAARRLTCVTAGHHLPVVLAEGGVRPVSTELDPEYPLGVEPDWTYRAISIDCEPGRWGLFCYTDGVVEAMNTEGEQYGQARMCEILEANLDAEPGLLIRRMRKAISGFCRDAEQSDDITMISIRLS